MFELNTIGHSTHVSFLYSGTPASNTNTLILQNRTNGNDFAGLCRLITEDFSYTDVGDLLKLGVYGDTRRPDM